MRRDEEFVGCRLAAFFGGSSRAFVSEGEDPPDLYLHLDNCRIGVEVTRLSEFTLPPDGTAGNRATQDCFGIRLLNKLDEDVGLNLPEGISLLVILRLPVSNASRFKKMLTCWVRRIAEAPKQGFQEDRYIEGSMASVSVVDRQASGKKIFGSVVDKNSSADIGMSARLILEDRIRSKAKMCKRLPRPIWLALLNDYWLANANTYSVASRQIKVSHCFERIFLVSDQGTVNELAVREGLIMSRPSASQG